MIIAYSLLELWSVIHHHLFAFHAANVTWQSLSTVRSLSQIHVSIGYMFCKLIILLFLGITSAVHRQKVSQTNVHAWTSGCEHKWQRTGMHEYHNKLLVV